jgi:hypothetical protein
MKKDATELADVNTSNSEGNSQRLVEKKRRSISAERRAVNGALNALFPFCKTSISRKM